MIVSGHQPVYLPWLGLFHKMSLCDIFVYMDTVQYLENDWNNRNKIRTPHGWMWLTVPIDHKKSTGKRLDQIIISGCEFPDDKGFWQINHWKSIERNYGKSPFFEMYEKDIKKMYLETVWVKLLDLCWFQLLLFLKWLGIEKKIVRMSEVAFEGKKDRLVLDHCLKLGADAVVFGKNGTRYVDVSLFHAAGITVCFQNYKHPVYRQRFKGFEPYMSILDLLLNYGAESLSILTETNVTYQNVLQTM